MPVHKQRMVLKICRTK